LWAAQVGIDFAIEHAYPSAAAAVASVAVGHRVDVLFGPYCAGPAVAAARAAPTVLWNHRARVTLMQEHTTVRSMMET
jgi:hypothetical protein